LFLAVGLSAVGVSESCIVERTGWKKAAEVVNGIGSLAGFLILLVAGIGLIVLYFRMKRVRGALSLGKWAQTCRQGRQGLGCAGVLFVAVWPCIAFPGLLGLVIILWPVGVLMWQGRMGQLCGMVGTAYGSEPLVRKCKMISRNWKLLVVTMVMLIILGVFLQRQPDRLGFVFVFIGMFILFFGILLCGTAYRAQDGGASLRRGGGEGAEAGYGTGA